MALVESHSRLLSAIDDYGEFGRKQNRKEGVMRGLEMLNESLSAAMERRRRKKEAEQARLDRQAEIEQGRKDDAAKEQRGVDRELFKANVDAETERLKKLADKQEKEELAAQNLPKVAEIKAMFRQAVEMKDRKSYLDAIDRYTDLDPEYQKKVPFDFYRDEFKTATEPPKVEKGPSPSERLADLKLQAIVDLQQKKIAFDEGKIDIEELKSAYANAAMFDASAFDKIPDWVFGESGGSGGVGGGNLTPDQQGNVRTELVEPMQSEGLTTGRQPGPIQGGPISILPKDVAVTKWGSEWATRYKTRIEEERKLWELDGKSENSPHNIEDPVVRFNISEEINSEMNPDTRTAPEKIVGGKQDGGLEKASKLDRAVESFVSTLTKKNNGVEPSSDQIIEAARSKADRIAPMLSAQGISIDEFIEHLGLIFTPAE